MNRRRSCLKPVCLIRKKEEKRSADLSGTDSGKAGICGSDTAAVSKIRNGWIRIEKPRCMQGGYTASGYIRSYRVRVCRTEDGTCAKAVSGSTDHDRCDDTGRRRLCGKAGRCRMGRKSSPDIS